MANLVLANVFLKSYSICAADYFCHIGDEEQTTVCCPGRAENMCMEPLVSGTGEAALNRFAYNALTRQCLPFVYSGIGGNQNNFLSKASCEASCPGKCTIIKCKLLAVM